MIRDCDILVFSDDWGRRVTSCQQLIRRFLGANRVLWVNTIGVRPPRLSAYDIKRSCEILACHCFRSPNGNVLPPANLHVCRPFIIPYNDRCSRYLNKKSVLGSVRGIIGRLAMRPRVVVTTFPHTVDYVDAFDGAASIYYCVDEFSTWENVRTRVIRQMEKDLIQKVDAVVACSEELYNSKKKLAKSIHLLTHGVDLQHFAGDHSEDETPPRLKEISPPIIGFFGIFDTRIDVELLRQLTAMRPSWSFVFVGTVKHKSLVLQNDNCHFLGPVPYEDLPRYMRRFDVTLLPYKIDHFIKNSNPLQLKECLAAGKAVVSTPIPAVGEVSQYVDVAGTAQEFARAIESCLRRGVGGGRTESMDFLKREDWSVKAEQLSCIAERLLRRKNSPHTHGSTLTGSSVG